MAANHVPSDQVPALSSQNIYTDPSYPNLFSSVDRYGNHSWEPQLSQHPTLAPAPAPSPSPQAWHHGTYAQQPFTALSQAYGNQPHSLRTASPYQYGQFSQQGAMPSYDQAPNVDPSLALDPNAVRQQQTSPYPMPMRNVAAQPHSVTVTPQALQQSTSSLQNIRPSASPFQVSALCTLYSITLCN